MLRCVIYYVQGGLLVFLLKAIVFYMLLSMQITIENNIVTTCGFEQKFE
jgi:hypothetical protein